MVAQMDALSKSNPVVTYRPLANYIQHHAPWVRTYAKEILGLAPGWPLALGGFYWD